MRVRDYCSHSSICDHWALRCLEQMSRSGDHSEVRSPVLKTPGKLGPQISTHCSRDERLDWPCPDRE
ncbi:hypothetical protein TNCV_4984361 [Trichonephila clavipes]|nr:hypothetical protein TNCV_4984361 [Trichonephila clavipes]